MSTEQQNWSQAVNDMGDRIERRMELMEARINVRFDQQDKKLDAHVIKFETHDTNDNKFQTETSKTLTEMSTRDAVVDKSKEQKFTRYAAIFALIFSLVGSGAAVYMAAHPIVVQAASLVGK